jgi:hypothetical protein
VDGIKKYCEEVALPKLVKKLKNLAGKCVVPSESEKSTYIDMGSCSLSGFRFWFIGALTGRWANTDRLHAYAWFEDAFFGNSGTFPLGNKLWSFYQDDILLVRN